MVKLKYILFIIMSLILMTSCSQVLNNETITDLDKDKLKGNVIRVKQVTDLMPNNESKQVYTEITEYKDGMKTSLEYDRNGEERVVATIIYNNANKVEQVISDDGYTIATSEYIYDEDNTLKTIKRTYEVIKQSIKNQPINHTPARVEYTYKEDNVEIEDKYNISGDLFSRVETKYREDRQKEYMRTIIFGKKKELTSGMNFEYDENGNIITTRSIDNNNEIIEISYHTYDANNNLIHSVYEGGIIRNYDREYTQDENKNWITQELYADGKLISRVTREILYE